MKATLLRTSDVLLATSLGAGFSPFAPGTMGAAVGVAVWWLGTLFLPYPAVWWGTLVAIVVCTLVAVPAINRLEPAWGEDPSRVVIDETVGVWICLLGVPCPEAWGYVLAAFVLFRAFDIAKPFGIRRMESVRGGWGVMLDDILSGIYGLLLMQAFRFIPFDFTALWAGH